MSRSDDRATTLRSLRRSLQNAIARAEAAEAKLTEAERDKADVAREWCERWDKAVAEGELSRGALIAAEARVEALEKALRECRDNCSCQEHSDNPCANCERIDAAIAGAKVAPGYTDADPKCSCGGTVVGIEGEFWCQVCGKDWHPAARAALKEQP